MHALGILCQTNAAFKSGHDKGCDFVASHISPNMPLLLSAFKGFMDHVLPDTESVIQSLPEAFIQRRHLLGQVIQRAAVAFHLRRLVHVIRHLFDDVDQSLEGVC